jgi:hypothetical protein
VRTGSPSIIEQARVLQKAAALGVQAIVCEVMGIKGEYQIPESKKILDPVYTVIVNARLDHPEQGESEAEVMKNYLAAVPAGSRFFLPPNPDAYDDKTGLVLELCRSLGLDEGLCEKAMLEAAMDRGAFRIFRLGKMECCNLFAANDVQSTRILVDSLPPGFRVGLFNSRQDRPERSLQFAKAVQDGMFDDVGIFFVMGSGTIFFKQRLSDRIVSVSSKDPEKIMNTIQETLSRKDDSQAGTYPPPLGHFESGKDLFVGGMYPHKIHTLQNDDTPLLCGGVRHFRNSAVQILGMGNIKGAEALLDYWQAHGDSVSVTPSFRCI